MTSCDFRLIKAEQYISFIHAKLGAAPGWGGARRLTNIVGRRNALKFLCSSKRIHPQLAMQIGLVDEIIGEFPCNDGETSPVEKFLGDILLQQYPGSLRAIKKSVGSVELETNLSKTVELQQFQDRW